MSLRKKAPFLKRRMRKETEKKEKEEARRIEIERKHEAERSKKKKTLIGLAITLALVSCFVGFMAVTSDETGKESDNSTIVGSSPSVPNSNNKSEERIISDKAENSEEENIQPDENSLNSTESSANNQNIIDLTNVPDFSGNPYVVINNNIPFFNNTELSITSFETYSDLDNLGRCGVAYASVGQDIMPTEERGSIGAVKPAGWHTIKYDCIDGKYLYNRCHLIGFQLTGENANTKNLITGTRYLNVDGMLPFENMVADYVKETNNHVQYRVTPIYTENNLIASGVLMEAMSVEDNGGAIQFNVYCYNNQPGISINYLTGDSSQDSNYVESAYQGNEENNTQTNVESATTENTGTYILNNNTMKFHRPNCYSVSKMKESNKQEYTGNREDLINQGYEACKNCNP